MILKQFFSYYFDAVSDETREFYRHLLPGTGNLVDDYTEVFRRNDDESIAFLLRFYRATAALRDRDRQQAILFNVSHNICFPFFFKYVWERMSAENQARVADKLGSGDVDRICAIFDENVALRNWFCSELGHELDQDALFTMNEVIALQNFSSGGEPSFLQFAYPYMSKIQGGRILDAGCGAGFATLVMSQYAHVYSVDACRSRLERAKALSAMMKKGEKDVFPGVIRLMHDELGVMAVEYDFPSAEKLLAGTSNEVHFHEGSIDSLPWEDNFFDAINCLDVLEHTFSPENIIREFSRVLKPGGIVLITAPTRYGEAQQRIHETIYGAMFPAMLHMHHFEPAALSEMFGRYGLVEHEMVPFDFMTWDEFMEIADETPDRELAEELTANPFDEVALQLFAVYRKAEQ
ncbi:MAG: methyltransferase domain-containing protein [Syntrophomonadaceae bacterium]|nr:methyltransferase domain-containing protein [Syntrophomonadaceae bacterium]